MASSSFKHLIRQNLPIPELMDIFKGLPDEPMSQTGVAIVGAALVEDALREAILFRMRDLTKKEEDELFDGLAPLAPFSAKIRIGYALRIYGEQTLNAVREIRNAFSHARTRISFSTENTRTMLGYRLLQASFLHARSSPNGAYTKHP